MDKVLEFIKRRFPIDCYWKSGNCYWFSVMLHHKFKNSDIYYDVIDGHFCVKIDGVYYDWEGVYTPTVPIKWDEFENYDAALYKIVIRDCVM